jgi:hypothetical protein
MKRKIFQMLDNERERSTQCEHFASDRVRGCRDPDGESLWIHLEDAEAGGRDLESTVLASVDRQGKPAPALFKGQ